MNNFVRIDMEDSSCTTDTLRIYRELRKDHSNVGVVIQAYLHRTARDVADLQDLRPNFRLCKGVYVEPPEIAYHDMREINRNYLSILETLLRNGSYVGIATHDESIVNEAFRLIRDMKLPRTAYEFQMLLGVTEQLRNRIVAAGHKLRVYIPYGRDWYAYSVRRLRENPRLAGYVLRQCSDSTQCLVNSNYAYCSARNQFRHTHPDERTVVDSACPRRRRVSVRLR